MNWRIKGIIQKVLSLTPGGVWLNDQLQRSPVGSNAVVTKDVPDGATVVGIPARIIKINGVPVKTEGNS